MTSMRLCGPHCFGNSRYWASTQTQHRINVDMRTRKETSDHMPPKSVIILMEITVNDLANVVGHPSHHTIMWSLMIPTRLIVANDLLQRGKPTTQEPWILDRNTWVGKIYDTF
ncbi:hypothetical protein KP509_07G029300 [Ceratopteris richardii]|uniref:Uncharacterized protein n=1 Tax=Ceratopteris richardii TaxID=49495 RepID=A0A8T2UGF2_CERRI|nr:hypothetical protein KP509_07G029300 [Ceratopteris richardii]